MKIYCLTRIRNESHLIKDTLDHMASFCDGVFVYDDCSTDNTVELCENHPIVKQVYSAPTWSPDRYVEETRNRQFVLDMARNHEDVSEDDWFCYMDADERLEFDLGVFKNSIVNNFDAIYMDLYDFYITPHDENKSYSEREYCGKEFRRILFFFKNDIRLKYIGLDTREVSLPNEYRKATYDFVKHYGKGFSVDEWDKTCRYYIDYFPKYADKWKTRIGKAVKHDMRSDFGTELITWNDKVEKGIKIN